MTNAFTESVVEHAALAWLESAGWRVAYGPDIAPDMPAAERRDYGEVVLAQGLRDALARLNPALPAEALDDAFRNLIRPEGADLIQRNRSLHRLLVDGVTVEYRDADGTIRGAQARVIDFDDPASNDWLAVNQFSVTGNEHSRRPDVVLFVNGLPLAVLELKNAADEDATIWTAFQQLQTYKAEVPSLFAPNAVLVVSDGVEARVGTLSAGREWFKPWRTIAGEGMVDAQLPEMQVVIGGILAPGRFLDLVRDFIVFEEEGGGRLAKKMAGYHQAVQAVLAKRAPGEASPEEELDHAVRQIISRAVTPEGVVDIFAAAGLAKPDISILSEEFLAEVRGMPQRNLAVELLQKLLKGELRTRRRKNLVQARSFAELLEQSLRRYQNRAIEAAQVIEELIALAKQMREADRRGVELDLSEDELAFYDALETNDSAVKVLGEPTLRDIARELVASVRANVTIDWTVRENVRAQLRVLVKRILRKHGYPPDKQEKATQTVLEQAAVLSQEWAVA
ncbi:MAG: DUF3387 domain-containing protein [Candidatus Rokubacteria bacterium]|nr:DUF3387 domain-containing protein [Candidatus Rokubacteria bacterium]